MAYIIVVMLTELFTAESKSQVYAAIHELLTNHSTIANNLSKYHQEYTQGLRVCLGLASKSSVS